MEEKMLDNENKYTVFNSGDVWILTKEKIASSTLKNNFNNHWLELYIDKYNYEIQHIARPDYFDQFGMTEERYQFLQNKISEDWHLFKQGSTQVDFIFLIRNPIHKFITGWVEDYVLGKLRSNNLEPDIERLKRHYKLNHVNNFIDYARKEYAEKSMFPETDTLPSIYKIIYEDFCFPHRHYESFFNRDCSSVFKQLASLHPPENLYPLWKLIFKRPFDFDKSKLHIIDIDLENIEYTLPHIFNIPIKREHKSNVRTNYLKYKSYKYLSQHQYVINGMVDIELFFWFELVSKLYPKEVYETNPLPPELKSIESYKKNYFMPDHLNFFDLQTHREWWKYTPPEVQLNYTDE